MANSIQQIAHGFNEFSKILVFVLQTISLLLYASCVFGTIGSAFSLQAFFQLFFVLLRPIVDMLAFLAL